MEPLITRVGELMRGRTERLAPGPPRRPIAGVENIGLPVRAGMELSPAELEIMDHIDAARRGIKDLGLRGNAHELDHAVHTLQFFVVKHAMQRLHFRGMSRWFWKDE